MSVNTAIVIMLSNIFDTLLPQALCRVDPYLFSSAQSITELAYAQIFTLPVGQGGPADHGLSILE